LTEIYTLYDEKFQFLVPRKKNVDINGRIIHDYKVSMNFGTIVLLFLVIRDEQRSILNKAMLILSSLQACNFLDKRGFSS
jgi:hypothetical protein